MDRVYLDGVEYAAEGVEALKLVFGLNSENQTVDYTTGEGLSFTGAGYDYLRGIFFSTDCNAKPQNVAVSVYLDCCDLNLDFSITGEGVTWCEEICTIDVDLQRLTDEVKAYRFLRDNIFWKNGFIDAYIHPRVYYCNQPGFVQYLLFSLMIPISFLIIVLQGWVGVIKGLCKAVTLFFGKCDLGRIEDISVCGLYEMIGGCGQYHPSPLIREILEFNTAKAGIGFKSSIFQSGVMANVALGQMQYEPGIREGNWIESNGANLTTIQLLELMKTVYNLDYRIIAGVLVVERKDHFWNIGTHIGEVTGCFTLAPNARYAYGDFKYRDDRLDTQSNRLRTAYDDVIEFNPEGVEWKSGKLEVPAPFGRARFMFDQRNRDRPDDVPGGDTETLLGDNWIDGFRSTNAFNFFGCRDDRRFNDMILTNDLASELKLLVLEPGFRREDAMVIRKSIGRKGSDTLWAYNYPMYFHEQELDGLYHKYHIIDHPDKSTAKEYILAQADLDWSCGRVKLIYDSKDGYIVGTSLGLGKPETVEIDPDANTIVAKNISIKCTNAN